MGYSDNSVDSLYAFRALLIISIWHLLSSDQQYLYSPYFEETLLRNNMKLVFFKFKVNLFILAHV